MTNARARRRHREHLRRVTVSDITPEQEEAMRRKARKCPMPGCGVWMTSKPHLPNSKELDHILPINQGGTHTHGNVRIICRRCNQKRPKDGSDYTETLTLWAQGEVPVSRPRKMMCSTTCRKGLHPWTPENIVTEGRKRKCRLCRQLRQKRAPLRECQCGAMFAAPGSTLMCPDCTLAAAHAAAYLHGLFELGWSEIAPLVGYTTAEGVRHAAKRIGYTTAPKPAMPKRTRVCPDCGTPKAGLQCEPCTTARAWQAVRMRQAGMTLRDIASQLGYSSQTTVTSLLKTVVDVRPYSRSIDSDSLCLTASGSGE